MPGGGLRARNALSEREGVVENCDGDGVCDGVLTMCKSVVVVCVVEEVL